MIPNARPIRIALLGLSLELYQKAIPDTIPRYEAFHRKLRDILQDCGEVVQDGLCYSRAEVEECVFRAETSRADILVVTFQSYHPSLNSLGALVRTSLPLIIWNTQHLGAIGPDFGLAEMIENHGMHGVQDLCNGLLRSGRRFGLVSGHHADPAHLDDLRGWIRAAAAASLSRRLRVGMLGHPFEGMGDFGVDETRMLTDWGPAVEPVSLATLAELAQGVDEKTLEEEMERDRERFEFLPDITPEDHRLSARLSVAVRRLAKASHLDALTQHFGIYGDDPRLGTCPFLGFNHLIAEGYGYAGEGNATIAALDALLTHLFGRSNFCEMFTCDYAGDGILFYHMGEGNYAMARKDRKPVLKKVPYTFGSGQPYVVPIFAYEPGPSTFVNLTTDAQGRFYLIGFEGEVTDYTRMEAVNAPHFKANVNRRLGDLLDAYSYAGGTHHLCRIEGRQRRAIERLARMLGMDLLWI